MEEQWSEKTCDLEVDATGNGIYSSLRSNPLQALNTTTDTQAPPHTFNNRITHDDELMLAGEQHIYKYASKRRCNALL